MEEPQLQKSPGSKKVKWRCPSDLAISYPRSDDGDDVQMTEAAGVQDAQVQRDGENSMFSSESIIYFALFRKVGLWILFVWILSHLHPGACFLLPLSFWLYSRLRQNVLNWVMTQLQAPAE